MRPDPHACRYVVVVRANQAELSEYLRRRLGADPTVEVVLDRRRGDRRRGDIGVAADRRRAERRRPPRGPVDAFDMPLITRLATGHGRHGARDREESAAMEPDKRNVPRESIDRWVVEGQTLFARLVEENEALRRRAETAELECEKIRHERGLLEREVDDLRREVGQLRAQQSEVVETFMRLLTHTDQMLRPVNELLERLKRGTPRAS